MQHLDPDPPKPRTPRRRAWSGRIGRRSFIATFLLAGGALAAGRVVRERRASDPVDPGEVAFATPAPPTSLPPTASDTAAPPIALAVALRPASLGQGEAAVIAVEHPGAASGVVRIFGRRFPLVVQGDRLWAVVGARLDQALGPAAVAVTTRDRAGAVIGEGETTVTVVAVERPVDQLDAPPEVTAVLTPEAAEVEAALRSSEQYNAFDARPRWGGTLTRPVDGPITTHFGQGRSINGGPVGGFHAGTDIANDFGTPIHAAAPGRVAWAGMMPIRGNTVLVDHGAGIVTGYSHLQEIEVRPGDVVNSRTVIGLMGSTGFSTGPHLHWELTVYGVNVDPMTWLEDGFLP